MKYLLAAAFAILLFSTASALDINASLEKSSVQLAPGTSANVLVRVENISSSQKCIAIEASSDYSELLASAEVQEFCLNARESTSFSLSLNARPEADEGSYHAELDIYSNNSLLQTLGLPVQINGISGTIGLSYSIPELCANTYSQDLELTLKNTSSEQKNVSLSAESSLFTPSLDSSLARLKPLQEKTVMLSIHLDPFKDYLEEQLVSPADEGLEVASCSNLGVSVKSIELKKNTERSVIFLLKNDSDYAFTIENMNVYDYTPNLSVTAVQYDSVALEHETSAIEVNAKAYDLSEGTYQAYLEIDGHFASGLSCAHSKIGTRKFNIIVRGESPEAACTDIQIVPSYIRMLEDTTLYERFTVYNNSGSDFEVEDFEVQEASVYFDAFANYFPQKIKANSFAEVEVGIEAFSVNADKSGSVQLKLGGSFENENCALGEIAESVQVKILNEETGEAETAAEKRKYSIPLQFSYDGKIETTEVEFWLKNCEEKPFSLSVSTACKTIEADTETKISFTLKNHSNETQRIYLNASSGMPLELLQSVYSLKKGQTIEAKLMAKPTQAYIGEQKIMLTAFNEQLEEKRELCINVSKGHAAEITLASAQELFKGQQNTARIDFKNTGAYREDFNVSFTPSIESAEISASAQKLTILAGETKSVYLNIFVPEDTSAEKLLLSVKADSQSLKLRKDFEFTLKKKPVHEGEEFLQIESYPKNILIEQGKEKTIIVVVSNISDKEIRNLKLYLRGTPNGLYLDSEAIPAIPSGETLSIASRLIAADNAEIGSFAAQLEISGDKGFAYKTLALTVAEGKPLAPEPTGFFGLMYTGLAGLAGSPTALGAIIILIIAVIAIWLAPKPHKPGEQHWVSKEAKKA